MPALPRSQSRSLADSSKCGWSRIFAELREDSAGSLPSHHADGIEVHLQTGTPVTVSWEQDGQSGSRYTKAGRTVVLRGRPYSHRTWSDVSQYLRLVVSPDAIAADEDLRDALPVGFWPVPNDPFAGFAELLAEELRAPRFMGDLLVELVLGVILRSARPDAQHLGPMDHSRLEAVIEYLLAKDDAPIVVAEIASHVGMSPFAFSRSLKQATGYSPYQLNLGLRVARAKSLLSGTPISGAMIAAAIGFHDEAHFSKAFKRVVGLTPREWRARLKQ